MTSNPLIVLMPVYEDWAALSQLLPMLDQELKNAGYKADVVLIDDGSAASIPNGFPFVLEAIASVEVVALKRNLGHQRAIAVGLSYVEKTYPKRSVVIMDADGEDRPEDVPRLIDSCLAHECEKIVFAARLKRSEGLLFTLLYHLYRFLHVLLTGIQVRVGNFSIVPPEALKRLVAVSELWNHYAAAVHKARLPFTEIPSKRGRRLMGSPRMDLVSLVVHGLSAMAVFGDQIGVRLLLVVSIAMSLTTAVLGGVICVRLWTTLAIPGWATYAAGLLFVMLLQMLLVVMVFVFVILAARNVASVLPMHDPRNFINRCQRIYG